MKGENEMSGKLNVAIIGQGRSGSGIHGTYFLTEEAKKMFKVVAVADLIEARREKAKEDFGCDVYEDYREFYKRDDIDLVVNSTFSHLHFPVTLDLLEHKMNVVVEKPFSKYAMECEKMIKAAKDNDVMLSVFQQSRLAPYYMRIREIADSGILGKIHQVSISFSGYCRRWDWQCSHRYYAGVLLNTGPHPMDQALQWLDTDDMPQVFSVLKKINSTGDAEDYAKVILTYPDRPLVDVEINCANAYSDGRIYTISGDRGSLKSTYTEITYKYFDEKPIPEFRFEPITTQDGVTPGYCTEELTWHEVTEKLDGTAFDAGTSNYYQNIYNHLTKGEELVIKPEKILQQIKVAELIHAQNPMEMKY